MFIMWLQAMVLSYVISNNVFSWITMVMSLSFIRYPKLCLIYQDLCRNVILVLILSSKSKWRKTVLYLSLCLIDKSSLCNLFFNPIPTGGTHSVPLQFFVLKFLEMHILTPNWVTFPKISYYTRKKVFWNLAIP